MRTSSKKDARRALKPVHVLRSDQFTPATLRKLFRLADSYERRLDQDPMGVRNDFPGHILVNTFYEPSTRTRMSFALAASHLGLVVHGTENAREFSSAIKGESDQDTARILASYRPSILVVRHDQDVGPAHMAEVSRVPVINAGAGKGEHPTQALLDLYTIVKKKGRIDGLVIAIGGDLKHGRTARSLAFMLCKYRPAKLIFVAPASMQIGKDVLGCLEKAGISYERTADLCRALPYADVVYWTRVQKERMSKKAYARVRDRFIIGPPEMALMKEDAILMHPLPRHREVRKEVDDDPRAWYFEQAKNGLYIRMALIAMLLTGTLRLPP